MGLLGSIASGIGSLIGGAAAAGIPDPKYKRAGLPGAGSVALENIQKEAEKSPDQYSSEQMEGVKKELPANASFGSEQQMTAMGMANAPQVAQALQNKASQKYANELSKVQRQADISGISKSLSAQNLKEQFDTQRRNISMQQDMIEQGAFQEAESNRNAVYSQLFSGIGGFAVNTAWGAKNMINDTVKKAQGGGGAG